MIKNGIRLQKRKLWRAFHENFGGTLNLSTLQPFSVDANLWNPNQNTANAPEECVGYSTADIATDIFKVLMSPDFSYAAALYLAGDSDTNDGVPAAVDGLDGLICLGALPQSQATITALQDTEAYVGAWMNWQQPQKQMALKNVVSGVYDALGNGDPLTSMLSAVQTGGIAVSCGTPWYPEWNETDETGLLPMPAPQDVSKLPWHCWNMKGMAIVNGQPCGIVKAWVGKWLYMPQNVANVVFAIDGTCANVPVLNGNRFASILGILAVRFPGIIPLIPEILNAWNQS